MPTKKTVELIESYSKVCNEIVQEFAKKHDMDFNGWIGDEIGGVASLQSPANKWHWVVFGFDQLLHAIVIITMSAYAIK